MSDLVAPLVKDFVKRNKSNDLGLEIEVESLGDLPPAPPYWEVKKDNSLRNNGAEYCTKAPILCNAKKFDKIKSLTDALSKVPLVHDCPRTSVHVHMNILRHTPLQVWTAVNTYWLLDNILVNYCGEEMRAGNVFCLRVKDAEGVVDYAIQDLNRSVPFSNLTGDVLRYSSQNINAIQAFGSLEYRAMRGTTDPKIIDVWSTELYNIVHGSKRFTDPAHMLDTYVAMGADRFMRLFLSDSFVDTLHMYGDVQRLTMENVGLLSEICYLHDWKKWEKMINETFWQKRKKMPDLIEDDI